MTITITNTDLFVEVNGVPCRVWEGTTEQGVPMHAYIPRVAVREDQDCSQFEAELQAKPEPSSLADVIPLRMIL